MCVSNLKDKKYFLEMTKNSPAEIRRAEIHDLKKCNYSISLKS